jgi:hypothetical protein
MIERIKLDDDQETYTVDAGGNQVVVILCLDGVIEIKKSQGGGRYALLNKYETWTYSSSPSYSYYDQPSNPVVQAQTPAGAEFLIIRYFRS